MKTLEELLQMELKDLYDAEHQIIVALPKLAEAAHSPELKAAFQEHLEQTRGQVTRLEQVFQKLGQSPERKGCKGVQGLIREGQELIQEKPDPDVLDAGLLAAAQKVEHYEIAGYGTLRTWARRLGHADVADLLQQTLNEEGETDQKLSRLAEARINQDAVAV